MRPLPLRTHYHNPDRLEDLGWTGRTACGRRPFGLGVTNVAYLVTCRVCRRVMWGQR